MLVWRDDQARGDSTVVAMCWGRSLEALVVADRGGVWR